jgi:hypothetical protein
MAKACAADFPGGRHEHWHSGAADRGEARGDISPQIATLPTDLFRTNSFLTRAPPTERVIAEIVDDVFLPLVANPS